jgi:hypothetical protein
MPVLWFEFDFAAKLPQMEARTGFITNGTSLKNKSREVRRRSCDPLVFDQLV